MNKEAVKLTIEGIKKRLAQLTEEVNDCLKMMQSAETEEKIMDIKRYILLVWLDLMPLSASSCYFCQKMSLHTHPLLPYHPHSYQICQ